MKYRQHKHRPLPDDPNRPRTVRGAYIHNLVDCIRACLMRRDMERARRAWAILVRCPDVEWRERWLWGLYLLTDGADPLAPPTFSQHEPGADAERYLKSLQVAAKVPDKPPILAELVLHLIRVGRCRAALEVLETYLPSYPYLMSAPLHTYAGLVCFYLAQPEAARGGNMDEAKLEKAAEREVEEKEYDSDASSSSSDVSGRMPPPNPAMLRAAREWFVKALALDPELSVAKEFLRIIDGPEAASDDGMDVESSADRGSSARSWQYSRSASLEPGYSGLSERQSSEQYSDASGWDDEQGEEDKQEGLKDEQVYLRTSPSMEPSEAPSLPSDSDAGSVDRWPGWSGSED